MEKVENGEEGKRSVFCLRTPSFTKALYGPDAGAPEAARTRVAQFSLSGTSYRNSGNETSTQLVIN